MTHEVIIVTRNRSVQLKKTIDALCSGTSLPNTIRVIDSSDAEDVLLFTSIREKCSNLGMRFLYTHISHRGISFARNEGIRRATSDVFCFLDDDEISDSHWMHTVITRFKKNPFLHVLTGPKRSLFPFNYWNKVWDRISAGIYPPRSGWTKFVSAGNSCYRRLFILRHHFMFDERMKGIASEDSVMSTHLYRAGIPIWFDTRFVVRHAFRTTLIGFFSSGMHTVREPTTTMRCILYPKRNP